MSRRVGRALALIILAACRGADQAPADAAPAPGDGASLDDAAVTDAPADAATDAPADAAPDAPLDAHADAPADAALDAPTDAPTDAAIDAGLDAPTDAAVEFVSPRYDTAFGAHCGEYGHATIEPMVVLGDGTVLSAVSHQGAFSFGGFSACRPDGTVARYSPGSTMWSHYLLSDGRLVGRYSSPPGGVVVTPSMTLVGSLADSTPFYDVFDAAGRIFVLRNGERQYDAETLAPLPLVAHPTRALRRCGPPAAARPALVQVGDQLVRVDPITWAPDPTYVPVSLAGALGILSDDDCSVVVVLPAVTGRQLRVHDGNGNLVRTVALPLGGESAMFLDHQGGVILSFDLPSPMIRLARVDLVHGGLDPAFGAGGRADLVIPGTESFDGPGSWAHYTLRVVGTDPAGRVWVFVSFSNHTDNTPQMPPTSWQGAYFTRVLVDH